MQGEEEFTCNQTAALRTLAGYNEPVQLIEESGTSMPAPSIDTANTDISSEDDDLHHLSHSDLVNIAKQLRNEIHRETALLSSFNTLFQNISQKREAIVCVLQLIDISASTDKLEVRSIAATARPQSIDEEWQQHVATHTASCNWWKSGNPRSLKSCSGNGQQPSVTHSNPPQGTTAAGRESGPASATPRGVPQRPPKGPTRKHNQEQPSNKNNSSFNNFCQNCKTSS